MSKKSVAQFNANLTSKEIFQALRAQQEHYRATHPKQLVLVHAKTLNKYAKRCTKAFRKNVKACQTTAQHEKLYDALQKRIKLDGRDFLNALL